MNDLNKNISENKFDEIFKEYRVLKREVKVLRIFVFFVLVIQLYNLLEKLIVR